MGLTPMPCASYEHAPSPPWQEGAHVARLTGSPISCDVKAPFLPSFAWGWGCHPTPSYLSPLHLVMFLISEH